MKPAITVFVYDHETGEVEQADVEAGDYLLTVTEPAYVHHTQVTGKPFGATHIITIKGRRP